MNKLPIKIWLAIAAILIAPGATAADADEALQEDEVVLEEVIVVGTRRQDRTALDTPVPIDVFGLEDLASEPSPELLDVLTTLVPSLNVIRQSLGDGLSFMRQPTMRGLDSDKTLMLVNGKRRHRGALVTLSGFGSNGPDMASIPTNSLRNVEVLRDGASAMYGSDAIAGVINLNLRNAASGGEINAQYGEFSLGNENAWVVSGNFGLPLGEDGFVNISFEWNEAEQTSRGGVYDRTIGQSGLTPAESALVSGFFDHDGDPNTPDQQRFGPDALTELWIDGQLVSLLTGSDGVPDDTDTRFADNLRFVQLSDSELVMLWGRPEREAFSTVVNAGYDLSGKTSLYGWATFSKSDTNRPATHRRVGRGAMLPVRTSDGAIYDSRDLYPAGFTPQFFGEITDYSFTGGMIGELDNQLSWDIGGRYGRSEMQYSMTNTLNPSLGPSTPTSFQLGNLISDEAALTADFTRPLSLSFADDSFLAFGFEYREEGYKSELGDAASFAVGPYSSTDPWDFETSVAEAAAGQNGGVVECRIQGLESVGTPCPARDPIHNVLSPASEAFPGYSPLSVFDNERNSWAVYADLELDITDSFLFTVAGRYEDFSDFGDNFSWRVASRYEFNDKIAVRGSIGTGFRAPTPGQTASLSVRSIPGQTREPTLSGVFPPSHPAAQIFGAEPLDAETSDQWTVGLAATPLENLVLTLDFYHIEVDDRFNRSSSFDVGPAEREVLLASGVPGASGIKQK
jgi:iron complex outermembrane receptor protein